MRAALALTALLSACASDPLGRGEPELGERFVGLWSIDQPNHAGYERTFYFFDSDGTLAMRGTEWLGSDCRYSGRACVTGFVHDAKGRYCEFAERWRSERDTLFIESRCDDGTSPEIALGFADDRNANGAGTAPISISVGGDTSFLHQPDWRFTRCPEGSSAYACNDFPSR